MKRKLSLILSLVLVLTLVMTGCGKSEEPKPANGGDEKTEESAGDANNPAKGRDGAEDTLVIGTHETKGEFLPGYYSETYDGYVVDLVFDGLITNDKEGNPIPLAAKDWEVSDDHLTYTFNLRDDIKFSDGEPLTAEDVEFTYTFICDPNYDGPRTSAVADLEGYEEYNKGDAEKVSGIEVIDDHTIAFKFTKALSTNIWNFGHGIMPKHVYEFEKGDIDAIKAKMTEPMGSGPFIFEKYEPKQYVEFKANEDYFLGSPKFSKLILKFTNVETQFSELEKGTVDIQLSVAAKGENKEILDGMDFVNIVEYPENSYGYIGFNMRDPRLADKKVRQALTYGFNRDQFAEVYYQGFAQTCNVPISQVSWAYTDEINEYKYDPDKAMKLLDEAGWKVGKDGIREKDGKKLEFVWSTHTDSKYVETMIPMLKSDWEKIGVKVEADIMEFAALSEKVYEKQEFDLYNMAWSLDVDPDAYEIFHSSQDQKGGYNSVGFKNEENDKLLEQGREEFDQEKRAEIYKKWGQVMNEELPYMFLTQANRWDVANKRVKNFETTPFQDIQDRDVILNIELE